MEENNRQTLPVQNPAAGQTPIVPPSAPVPENPKPKLKLSILIGVVVLFSLIIGVASATYIFILKPKDAGIPKQTVRISPAPTINPNANWKTYTNSKYGYSFSYPGQNFQFVESPDLVLEDSPSEGNYSSVFGCVSECEAYTPSFGIIAFENRNNWSLNSWLSSSSRSPLKRSDNVMDNLLTECINKDPRTKRTVGTFLDKSSTTLEYSMDQEMQRLVNEGICNKDTFLGGGGGSKKWIFVESKGQIIAIQINFGTAEENEVFGQILSTFKFTDQNQTINTSNWRTFENSKFSIKYPSNWIIDNQYQDEQDIAFKSADYQNDGGLPLITKGFTVRLLINRGVAKDSSTLGQISSEPTVWLGKKAFLVKSGWEGAYVQLKTDPKEADLFMVMNVPNFEAFEKEKKEFLTVAESIILK